MALAAKVYIANQADHRGEERTPLAVGAVVRREDARPIEAEVRNLSRTGCLVMMRAIVNVGSLVTIGISGIGRVDAHVVRRAGDECGCEFLQPISREMVDAAQDAVTVVAFPERFFVPSEGCEGTMPDPDRWSRGARVGFLFTAGISFWVAIIGILQLL